MTDPMQQAIQRVLQGEPTKRVARELGVPESSVRYHMKRLKPPVDIPKAQIAVARAQIEAQIKPLGPRAWVEDAKVIQAFLVKTIAKAVQGQNIRLRDLVLTFAIITDKIREAETVLPKDGAQAVAAAQATVVIKVQEGGKTMTLEEFVGRPPSLAAGSAESLSRETETQVP